MLNQALSVDWETYYAQLDPIPGHLHPGQEKILADLALSTPDDAVILEIGSFKGRSTAALAYACIGTNRKVYTIDTFRGLSNDTNKMGRSSFLPEFFKHLEWCGALDYVEPLIGFSNEFYDSWDKPIDMLFIDGGHEYDTVRGDFVAFFPWLKQGGIIAMHDVWNETPDASAINGPTKVWQDNIGKLHAGYCVFHNLGYGVKA